MGDERTIVITGATDGLGKGLATELAPSGARLILHGRNEEKGQALLEELRPRAERRAGLAPGRSLLARRGPAACRGSARGGRIDVFVNNAGIGTAGGREESADGYELTFAVNYLAPFLLTEACCR